jgi:hypothetical protein
VNASLSQQVQAFLHSSLDSLTVGTGNLDHLDQLTSGLFSNLQDNIQTAIANGTYNPADYSGISIDGAGFNAPTSPTPASRSSRIRSRPA